MNCRAPCDTPNMPGTNPYNNVYDQLLFWGKASTSPIIINYLNKYKNNILRLSKCFNLNIYENFALRHYIKINLIVIVLCLGT